MTASESEPFIPEILEQAVIFISGKIYIACVTGIDMSVISAIFS